jgi:hypothetical protein
MGNSLLFTLYAIIITVTIFACLFALIALLCGKTTNRQNTTSKPQRGVGAKYQLPESEYHRRVCHQNQDDT